MTTHSLLYSKVPVRSLEEHPRLTPEARTKVHGGTSAPVYTRKAVLEVVKNGVPLCWHEMLPIQLYVALYKHFDITCATCRLGRARLPSLRCSVMCRTQACAAMRSTWPG